MSLTKPVGVRDQPRDQPRPSGNGGANRDGRSRVLITAIVPCRNERDHIGSCLQSILDQDLPPDDVEILVVDGLSDDGTRDMLATLAAQDPRIRVVDNPHRFKPAGLNLAIRAAKGAYIAVMDAHNRYASDYLRASVEVIQTERADAVGGGMVCEAESYVQKAVAAAHHSPFASGGGRWRDPDYEGVCDTVFCGVYRREVFSEVGLFDERLIRNQDDEFNFRLARAGGKVWQSPRIKCWYRPRQSLGRTFKQYFQYGYWRIPVIQKYGTPSSWRQLVPGGFVLVVVGAPLLSLVWPMSFWLWITILGVYGAGAVAAAASAARVKGWELAPILPLVFFCYHFGYGLGFLRGVLDFVILRRGAASACTALTRSSKLSA